MKESDLQRQILDYFALKRDLHYRQNSGAFDNGKGGFYRFGALGRAGHYLRDRRLETGQSEDVVVDACPGAGVCQRAKRERVMVVGASDQGIQFQSPRQRRFAR
ncbi:MAG TPA: hypothetical protein VN901_07950 [Candidatus Acidoferrales bacterium]|nr:hypothetical protein [Candidatus Acidoferrales bacterium]